MEKLYPWEPLVEDENLKPDEIVNRETMLASSASAIINGIVAITLLLKFGRMQRATPHVIMDNETMSNKCCHENEMILFFMKNKI